MQNSLFSLSCSTIPKAGPTQANISQGCCEDTKGKGGRIGSSWWIRSQEENRVPSSILYLFVFCGHSTKRLKITDVYEWYGKFILMMSTNVALPFPSFSWKAAFITEQGWVSQTFSILCPKIIPLGLGPQMQQWTTEPQISIGVFSCCYTHAFCC